MRLMEAGRHGRRGTLGGRGRTSLRTVGNPTGVALRGGGVDQIGQQPVDDVLHLGAAGLSEILCTA